MKLNFAFWSKVVTVGGTGNSEIVLQSDKNKKSTENDKYIVSCDSFSVCRKLLINWSSTIQDLIELGEKKDMTTDNHGKTVVTNM